MNQLDSVREVPVPVSDRRRRTPPHGGPAVQDLSRTSRAAFSAFTATTVS